MSSSSMPIGPAEIAADVDRICASLKAARQDPDDVTRKSALLEADLARLRASLVSLQESLEQGVSPLERPGEEAG